MNLTLLTGRVINRRERQSKSDKEKSFLTCDLIVDYANKTTETTLPLIIYEPTIIDYMLNEVNANETITCLCRLRYNKIKNRIYIIVQRLYVAYEHSRKVGKVLDPDMVVGYGVNEDDYEF